MESPLPHESPQLPQWSVLMERSTHSVPQSTRFAGQVQAVAVHVAGTTTPPPLVWLVLLTFVFVVLFTAALLGALELVASSPQPKFVTKSIATPQTPYFQIEDDFMRLS